MLLFTTLQQRNSQHRHNKFAYSTKIFHVTDSIQHPTKNIKFAFIFQKKNLVEPLLYSILLIRCTVDEPPLENEIQVLDNRDNWHSIDIHIYDALQSRIH